MFGKKKGNDSSPVRVESIIGKGTNVGGDLYCKGSLRVEGSIEGGEVVAAGDVFIGQGGKVVANIKGRNIIIAGDVRGDVDAKEKLEIVPSGSLIGDIKMSTLVIEDGATFKGKSESRKGESISTAAATRETNDQKKTSKKDK